MFIAAMDGDKTGRWEIRLASSSDGFHWKRFHTRQTYLGRGPVGTWDGGGIIPSGVPVRREEDLLIYYSGMGLGQEEQGYYTAGVGLARAKIDRFVEQRGGRDEPGYLLTKELIFEGNTLRVNVERGKGPYRTPRFRAEILRHPPLGGHWLFQHPFPGFTFDDCDPMAIDHTNAAVTWKGNKDISSLAGKPVYLRFELCDTGLFSFRVTRE